MKFKFSIISIFLFIQLGALPVFSQSLPFKTLLKSKYDKDFPVVYPDQEDILEKAIILDTREKEEFKVSHLRGARWVGYETFSLEQVKDIPKESPVVVYCSIGARSQKIGKKLQSDGYQQVYNLYGGIFHWINEENRVYKEDTLETLEIHAYNKIWGIWIKKGIKVY